MEIRIPWAQIKNSQTITPAMERIFRQHGLDLSRDEVTSLVDDPETKERVLTVKRRTYHLT
jgi:hypothetical protein